MCCVYDGLEPYNHYEPQQDTNNPNPRNIKSIRNVRMCLLTPWNNLFSRHGVSKHAQHLRVSIQYVKGKAAPPHTYGGAGGREGIAPTH
jgi:hypothetical protein